MIPKDTWVKSKRSGGMRYITKHNKKDCFEDDGKISGQPASPYCHYDNYEAIIKTQEQLDRLVETTAMIGNIYYDDNMNYILIDWEKEYIKVTDINNLTIIERIKL